MGRARGWLITAAAMAAFVGLFFVGGLTLMPVKTGSMRPTLQPGDVVIGVKPWLSAPAVGKVVVATPDFAVNGDRLPPIAHRIIDRAESGTGWVTKGDYNPEADGWTVRPGDVQRVMVAHLPVRWVQSPLVIVGAITLLALAWLWPRKPVHEDDVFDVLDGGAEVWPQVDPDSWQAQPWARLQVRSAGLPYVTAMALGQQRLHQATQGAARAFRGHERILVAPNAAWQMSPVPPVPVQQPEPLSASPPMPPMPTVPPSPEPWITAVPSSGPGPGGL